MQAILLLSSGVTMKRLLCLLLLPIATASFSGIKEDEDAAARRDMMMMMEKLKAANAERERRENMLPYPDTAASDLAAGEEAKWISDWKQDEKQRFVGFLDSRDSEIDVLLVPVQVQANGIERANRSLMTASLAQAISGSVKVADPYLVARALGDGERRLNPREVIQLAGYLRAKRILWTYAGHRFDKKNDRYDNRLHLYFQLQERGKDGVFAEGTPTRDKVIDTLEFSDNDPPVTVFRRNLPQIVETLGFRYQAAQKVRPEALKTEFPSTPAAAVAPSGSLANGAQQLQLLASLLPRAAARTRERFLERSLLIAWQLPPEHPSSRVLLARALAGLRMRPLALATLGKPANDDERAIVAALNGNLPELEAVLTKMPMSVQKVMAEIDATDIRYAYESKPSKIADAQRRLAALLPAPWRSLLQRRFDDADPVRLRRFDNLELLKTLGDEFPDAGAGIAQKLRGWMVTGRSERADLAEIDLAVAAYFAPTLGGREAPACCDIAIWQPGRRDLLDFLTQSVVANVVYKAHRLAVEQALYREALNYINAIDAVFGTHPEVMRARAQAETALANLAEPSLRDRALTKAHDNAARANHWLRGTLHAWSDRPSHLDSPYYARNGKAMPGHLENARSALANATHQTGPLVAAFYLTPDPADKEKLLRETSDRFVGEIASPLLEADLLKAQGRNADAIARLQTVVKGKPEQIDIYRKLGNLLMDMGNYAEAAKAYRQYPGLEGPDADRLVVDNYAYKKGSLFFWRGETDLAREFFKISAAQNTGSAAGMTSAARNACVDGDYGRAAEQHFNAAQRYGSSYRYRDYFNLLHMLGESAPAWDGFEALVGRFTTPHLWDSALVGHQREGRDAAWIIDWSRKSAQQQGGRALPLARRYLTMAMLTDRIPDKRAFKAVDTMVQTDMPYRTLYSLFLEAYAALKQKDFALAYRNLSEAGTRDRLTRETETYVLPYLAIAGARSGKAAEVEALLATIPEEQRQMDYWLSRSALDAIAGKPEAVGEFRRAIDTRVFTESRPLGVEYQFADVAEMLFELTENPEFKAHALHVARFNQKIQPWEGWAYAQEAALTSDAQARKAAVLKARYLDRNSERLKRLPKSELNEADAILKKSPPFRLDLRRTLTGI